jgi:hypothetical protein
MTVRKTPVLAVLQTARLKRRIWQKYLKHKEHPTHSCRHPKALRKISSFLLPMKMLSLEAREAVDETMIDWALALGWCRSNPRQE